MFWNACSKLRKALSPSAPKNLTACCANILDLWLMWTSAEKAPHCTYRNWSHCAYISRRLQQACNLFSMPKFHSLHFVNVFDLWLLVSWCFKPSQPQRITSGLTFDCSGPWPKHTPNYTVQSLISFCKYFQMLAASEGSFWPLQHPEISQPALHQRPWPGQEHQAAVRICALSPPSGPCWLPRHDATGGVMGEHHDQGRVVSLWCVYS